VADVRSVENRITYCPPPEAERACALTTEKGRYPF